MYLIRIIWCVFLFVLSLNVYGLNGSVPPIEKTVIRSVLSDSCSLKAKYFPGSDTVVSNGSPIFFENQSLNSSSFSWFINGVFTSSQKDFTLNPSLGVNEIMLVASNGICTDTSFSY